ncbi:hypothetical protein RIR_jg1298.t1 [Rhizophagus irregularis DAOM 181602=DAOM 197198]|nr:hypothetical protein RIR_jg1298.t1 [Rhizophagus irregularis DAOM 181602=DAOM 197198]
MCFTVAQKIDCPIVPQQFVIWSSCKNHISDYWLLPSTTWNIKSWDEYFLEKQKTTIHQSHSCLADEIRVLKQNLKSSTKINDLQKRINRFEPN